MSVSQTQLVLLSCHRRHPLPPKISPHYIRSTTHSLCIVMQYNKKLTNPPSLERYHITRTDPNLRALNTGTTEHSKKQYL